VYTSTPFVRRSSKYCRNAVIAHRTLFKRLSFHVPISTHMSIDPFHTPTNKHHSTHPLPHNTHPLTHRQQSTPTVYIIKYLSIFSYTTTLVANLVCAWVNTGSTWVNRKRCVIFLFLQDRGIATL
jgi:hypothetical protein